MSVAGKTIRIIGDAEFGLISRTSAWKEPTTHEQIRRSRKVALHNRHREAMMHSNQRGHHAAAPAPATSKSVWTWREDMMRSKTLMVGGAVAQRR